MEREFSGENMEEFLRQNADGLRMRPSARVWKGISTQLNRRRRKFGWILGTSLLLTTALGYYLVNESAKSFHNSTVNYNSRTEKQVTKQISETPKTANELIALNRTSTKSTKTSYQNNLKTVENITNPETFTAATNSENTFSPTIVDSYFDNNWPVENNSISEEVSAVDPLSIESVVNSYKAKKSKLGWQTYFTPTVSYRRLNNNYIESLIPHKPAFGFQLGVAAKYAVSKSAKLRAGLQFNVNRYEIKTYDSYSQLATIRLSDRNGVSYMRPVTNYNNFNGYKSNWLQNFYFQISAPVGIELKLKGDDKVQFGVASTVQPTYMLGERAYVISTDYKNYAEMPSLVRRWNVNTNFETFVGYSTGRVNWQVGPQVRYQLLSSYVKKYPVKENLFDFGMKVGLSFNK
jgi:hypothetical protein